MTPRQHEIINELAKLGIKYVKRIESKPPRLQFSYDLNHPFDVYRDEGPKIREKLVELANNTMPTYAFHSSSKTLELTLS